MSLLMVVFWCKYYIYMGVDRPLGWSEEKHQNFEAPDHKLNKTILYFVMPVILNINS